MGASRCSNLYMQPSPRAYATWRRRCCNPPHELMPRGDDVAYIFILKIYVYILLPFGQNLQHQHPKGKRHLVYIGERRDAPIYIYKHLYRYMGASRCSIWECRDAPI